ncbi:hypothetical protein TTHERM_00918480 (macronuclear) [Tetrahymena thermophila SB210]|uniref:Uncharacterized protein n=1 Tax=Tetrahymena thermophila (strain SB210) TaxID=312017 RepID=Q24IM7_TETTS|nr:hypothetical protein TTHERM_00918480 [Tetrahymena thermophila SB210]EAS07598.2 hypothetical protein TTHERM_00918480 [Tetrahymena thermophila SB210]|eukprot:XP_001027840.2 hypothetical protein TTHERM_00918480 [Tetrahymena thermophila SB210]
MLNYLANQEKNALSDNPKNHSQDVNKRFSYAVKNNMNSENERQASFKSQKQSQTQDQSNKSRSKILDGQKFIDMQGEDEELNPKFALLDAETASANNQSILKTRNVSKKKSLDSWDQEDPGFTDVRSFGNTLSAFKSKQFYQNNRPFPYRNQPNFPQKFGNRSNFHFGGTSNSSSNQQTSNLRNQKETNNQLVVSSQKFSPKQMEYSQKVQLEGRFIDGINQKNNGERNIEEGNTSEEEEEKNSQMLRVTEEQFLKWENKEIAKDIYQNQLMKKYGDSQINQNAFYNFHLSNSPNSLQPLAEMKIYGNSFNSLRKDQEQNQQETNTQQQQLQQKLKKIDLNTNLKFPTQNNQQILFPSSFNINLHIQNNQQVLQQFKSQQRLKSFQQYKYHTNYYKDSHSQLEENKAANFFNNQNTSIQYNQISQDNSNLKNVVEPKEILGYLDLEKEDNEENQSNSFINKPIQVINTLSSKVAPIHSKKIYNQEEFESEADSIINSRVLDFNFNTQIKSKSLSPLRFPKHRAIPPIRLRQKKREREEGQHDYDGNRSIQNLVGDSEHQNQQNQILLIKNISLIQKNIQNQKQTNIPSTNIHSPGNFQQVDQLLNIISPSLYPQQLNLQQQNIQQIQNQYQNYSQQQQIIPQNQNIDQSSNILLSKQYENENSNNNIQNKQFEITQIQSKNDIKVNQVNANSTSSDKMKVFQLKFNGNQFGKSPSSQENITTTPSYIQKYVKKKQSPSPRQQSPWLNAQNQAQNNIPSLIINQIQSLDQQALIQKKFSQNSLTRKDSSHIYHLDSSQKIKNTIDSKVMIQTGSPKSGQLLNQYQQHIDFMDYIQGKSANIGQKQSNTTISDKQDEIKKQNYPKIDQNIIQNQNSNIVTQNNQDNKFNAGLDNKQRLDPVRKVKTAFVPNQQPKQQHLNQSFQGKVNKNNQKFHKFGQQKKVKNTKQTEETNFKQEYTNNKNQDHNQLLIMNSFKNKQNIQQKQEELQVN